MPVLITAIGILVALAAQALFVLFLQNWGGVGVDLGEPVPTGRALLINTALVLAFGAVHSLMARPAFKRVWIAARAERGVYLLVSGLTLAGLCHLWQPITEPVLWSVAPGAGRVAVLAVFFAAWACWAGPCSASIRCTSTAGARPRPRKPPSRRSACAALTASCATRSRPD